MFHLAFGSVPAHWHRGMFKWTVRIRAIRVELALFVCLMSFDLGRTRVSAHTFGVLAGCTERTRIRHIDRSSGRSSWRLMNIFAVFVGAAEVVVAHRC